MEAQKQTSRQIRDRICSELYAELQVLGFSEPKAGKLHYLRSPDKHWKIYLEIRVAQRWGEYNVMPMFVVNWSRIRELKKRMEPEQKHDYFLFGHTFLNLVGPETARSDDVEPPENGGSWYELYVPETGEIEPAVVRILDVFSLHGISWLRKWSNKESALQDMLEGKYTAWFWLITFALIAETRGIEEACCWLNSLEDPPSALGLKQVEFLRKEFCDGACGVC